MRKFVTGIIVGVCLTSQFATLGGQGIRHKKTSPFPDSTDTRQIQPSNWNDEHTFDRLAFTMVAPTNPRQGDCWMLATGTTPSRVFTWQCFDQGVTYTLWLATR